MTEPFDKEQDVIKRLEQLENTIRELIESVALLTETTDTAIRHLAGHVSYLTLQLRVNQTESEDDEEDQDIQKSLESYYEDGE